MEGRRVWLNVLDAIEQLQRTRRRRDEPTHWAPPATTTARALAGLQHFWHSEYENHPDHEGEGNCQLLKDAIEALGGEVFFMPWTEEAVRARPGHLECCQI